MESQGRTAIFGSIIAIAAAVAGFTAYHTWKRRALLPAKKNSSDEKPCLQVDRQLVKVIQTEAQWNSVLPSIQQDLAVLKVLGLDCEWVGTNPISLLQIASHSGLSVLIRLRHFTSVPDSLKAILTDKGILKVGVAVCDDAQRLHKDHGLCVRGCVDLRYLAARSRKYEVRQYGLKNLAEAIIGVTLEKGTHIRCSDWQAPQLSPDQIQYAAGDALVAIKIFSKLVHDRLSSVPGTSYTQRDVRQKSLSLCQGIVDVKFSIKTAGGSKTMGGGKRPRDLFKPVSKAYSTRNKPLYHNCQLWAPDGQLLCTCDVKKALWYVEKGLATKVRDEPLTVQLKFEPSGRPVSEANYYLQEKENICVVCGNPESFTKKNVVPHEYRKYFPAVMKDHKSHDVVLLCVRCHQLSGQYDTVLRQQLEKTCDAPISTAAGAKYKQDHTLSKVKSAAKALLNGAGQIPVARRDELEEIVRAYYQLEEVTQDVLQEAATIDTKLRNENYSAHGQMVVKYMMEHEGLIYFERLWRQHFLDSMAPQFLPPLWSVDHSHDRLADMDTSIKGAFSGHRRAHSHTGAFRTSQPYQL